ncbi:Clavaminate synthase-like protein [Microthyrium microscopicum]|uniref:Clavaminate synthase-like protein n=1 Tax=Microthyrium microscopicum TaxID=703497 RepID=A0A6A6UDS6_9PEZI|nr:Clavaminate synthase-like protein [Microthyrium microscopicum]
MPPATTFASSPTGLHNLFLTHEHTVPSSYEARLRADAAVPLSLDSTLSTDGPFYDKIDRDEDTVWPGPDIQWMPSHETYVARAKALAKLAIHRPTRVPAGFPDVVIEPWAWTGNDTREEDYVLRLSDAEVTEVDAALAHYKTLGLPSTELDTVQPSTFPLPLLEPRLRDVAGQVHEGLGFQIIRGLEPRRYTAWENIVIYLGITSYVADKRAVQDSSGNMLIHIKDLGYKIANSDMRQSPYASNAQPFHNDVCDVLAMYVQEEAAEGGESHLASSAKVYNEIAANRPDAIHTLSQPNWIFDKHRVPAFYNTRALLFNFGARGPAFCFSRRPITGSPTSPRSPGVPPMSEVQAEAIDMVHFTAWKNKVTIKLRRGDIQLINNLACQHARENFVDKPLQRRQIIRLWLRNEDMAWETPEGLKKTWFEKYGDSERRKIATWNILPGALRERVLFRSDSCS